MENEEYVMMLIRIHPKKISLEKLLSFINIDVTKCPIAKNFVGGEEIFSAKIYFEMSQDDGPDEEGVHVKCLYSFDEYIFSFLRLLQFKIVTELHDGNSEIVSASNPGSEEDEITSIVLYKNEDRKKIMCKRANILEIPVFKILKLANRVNDDDRTFLYKDFPSHSSKIPPPTLSPENKKILLKNIINRVGVGKKVIIENLISSSSSSSSSSFSSSKSSNSRKKNYDSGFFKNCFVTLRCFKHDDKKASLSLNLLTLRYKCFGCKTKGVINNDNFQKLVSK
nr:MAG: hypothetical protein [Porcellio scaber clopovirus]